MRSYLSIVPFLLLTAITSKSLGAVSNVTISSSPPGANVYIDNIDKGIYCQTRIPCKFRLSQGVHRIILQLTGYLSVDQKINVNYDEQFIFPLKKSYAKLTVKMMDNIDPAGTLYLDGQLLGKIPMDVELAEGRHYVELRLPGAQPYIKSIVPLEGELLQIFTWSDITKTQIISNRLNSTKEDTIGKLLENLPLAAVNWTNYFLLSSDELEELRTLLTRNSKDLIKKLQTGCYKLSFEPTLSIAGYRCSSRREFIQNNQCSEEKSGSDSWHCKLKIEVAKTCLTAEERIKYQIALSGLLAVSATPLYDACNAHKTALRDEAKAKAELLSIIVDMSLGLAIPNISSIIVQFSKKTTKDENFIAKVFPTEETARLALTTAQKYAGYNIKANYISLFGENNIDHFLNEIKEEHLKRLKKYIENMDNMSDAELLSLYSLYLSDETTLDAYRKYIGELIGEFKTQIEPIDKVTVVASHVYAAKYIDRLVLITDLKRYALVETLDDSIRFGTSYRFITWISERLKVIAIKKAEKTFMIDSKDVKDLPTQ